MSTLKDIFEIMQENAAACIPTKSDAPELERERKAMEEQTARENWRSKKRWAGIPPRYSACSFSGIEKKGIPTDCVKLYEVAKDYAEHIDENRKNGRGVLFIGSCGRMKTTFAVAIMQAAMRAGASAHFIPMAELLDRLLKIARGGNKEWESRDNIREKIADVDFLVLDDLGAEYKNDWILNTVDAVITHRFNSLKPTIITTNLSPDELKGRYAGRVIDRLKASSLTIVTDGESKRPDAGVLRV